MLFNVIILFDKIYYSLILFYIFSLYHTVNATELRIREDSKLFIRFNLKINSVEYSLIFAHAIGFRVNFDLRKSKKPKELYQSSSINTYFHPEKIQKTTEYLFNAYGYNSSACLIRTMCEISCIPEHPYNLIGPIMKLAFLGSPRSPKLNTRVCNDARHCPISVLHLLSNNEFS